MESEKHRITVHTNIIYVKDCLFGCSFVKHTETTEQILFKYGIQAGYEPTSVTGYFLSHGTQVMQLAEASKKKCLSYF